MNTAYFINCIYIAIILIDAVLAVRLLHIIISDWISDLKDFVFDLKN